MLRGSYLLLIKYGWGLTMEPFLMLRGQREVGGPPVTVVSEMNLRVQEGKGQRGVELGEGEGVVGAPEIQKHREDGVGGVGRGGGKGSKEKYQDRQNVTNWEFLEYVPSPNPKRAAERVKKEGGTPRRRKSGRPAGFVGEKKKECYQASTGRSSEADGIICSRRKRHPEQ